MKTISDEEYNNALNNPEYISIMNCAAYPFQQLLHKDILSRCILIGLFDFLRKYDPKRSKPSTFLTKCVRWECMNVLPCPLPTCELDDLAEPDNHQQEIDDYLSCLNNEDKQLVIDYYISKYTYREIAKKHDCSHEHIRKKINKALAKMRKMAYN
jgi:DNA-directed RNA polymerase specialized sigma24 family protein